MKPCTLWYRKTKNSYEFNHLDNGHQTSAKPPIKHPSQTSLWNSGEWKYEHAWLTDEICPKVIKILL